MSSVIGCGSGDRAAARGTSGVFEQHLMRAVTAACFMSAGMSPDTARAELSMAPSSLFVQYGAAGSTRELAAGATRNWAWSKPLATGRVTGYWEGSVSRWSYADQSKATWLGKLAVTPVFRYRPNNGDSPWFGEAAIGLTLTTTLYATDRKSFSTRFNFGDHIAIGRNFGEDGRYELALRIEHLSNAGIQQPNPGENFVQVRLSYRFR
jgi:lipid A 3-O-deacylase